MNKILTRSKVMDEIHAIREKMHEETKGMSFDEKIKFWGKQAEDGLANDGYEYLTTPAGYRIIKRKG